MKDKRNGFALVELLAVILVLAVLTLLALPQVLKIMDSAKKNALKTEALTMINVAEEKLKLEGVLDDESIKCLEYSSNKNDLDGFWNYKDGYTARIIKQGATYKINLSNGAFYVSGLTKGNSAASTSNVKEGKLTDGGQNDELGSKCD